ncbi:MAG TPA: hypothetical protein PLF13_08470 [candidate division Zixibacteria bacterium]|nr:hypothetical protein [candidate division Zixibacteria bacterium]
MRFVTTLSAFILMVVLAAAANASEITPSVFDQALTSTRYGYDNGSETATLSFSSEDAEEDLSLSAIAQAQSTPPDYKSPGKAFLYSLAVPGLGQWYYGSRIKPVAFLALEVLGWSQALKYHSNGNDLTDEYEQFNRDHWMRARYYEYLVHVYDTTRPDLLSPRPKEITHVLPDQETQQFFEMTGKYSQFAWAWDDAELNGLTWDDLDGQVDTIKDAASTPASVNREKYETMRNDANNEYDKSMKFVFVIMANHLVSAFEAYFMTKGHNNSLRYDQEFARVKIQPGLRSYYSWKDTPYVTVSYRF